MDDVQAAEDALSAIDAPSRAFLENSSEGIVVAELDTRAIRYANPAASRMLGYAQAELATLTIDDLHPKEALPYIFEHIAVAASAAARGETALPADIPCVRKDGSIIQVTINGTFLTLDGRRMSVGFFQDVTERRRAERALRASEARYRRLFEVSRDGILLLDGDDGRVIDANPFITELTGHTRDALLNQGFCDLALFRDGTNPRSLLGRMQVEDYVEFGDIRITTRSGETVDVELMSNAYVVDDRAVIQCNLRDVTLRKHAEAERRRLVTAIEQADETVVVTDARGDITYVNPAFEAASGYARAEALGHNPRMLKSGVQDDAFYRALWTTISGGSTWRGRLVNRRKNGALYTEDATISPVRDPDGVITSYVCVKRDVTAALVLEQQFLQAQKMEAVGRLAGGVAHDFNNVLSVILSYAEMIGSDLKPDEPLRADVDEIRRAALRAADLTRQLLAFSRRQVLETKVVNINQILAGIEKMITRLLGADVHLTILAANGLWSVKADPGQLEQVVMNLVVNARDAMPRGGRLTIETANVELDDDYARLHRDVPPGAYVEIAVSDTGTGMDAETQARIFEPFFTTKEKGKGTGLGLATVFGIVQQSGGHLWVYSEPGRGTTFKVYLPRFHGVSEAPPSMPLEVPSERGTETILLVEDEDQVRVLARNILRRAGYVVLDAPNGGEALLICEQHDAKIHLLLTDVVLPKMSGRQLAERLSAMRPEMKVLFMSGYTDDAILLHGILDSGVAFLQKPLTPRSLAQKVREALDSKKGVE